MTWATVADVLTLTGKTVAQLDIAAASDIIDIYANRTEAASSSMGNRDLHWLNRATIWQAVFYADQPGLTTRQIVATHKQDGVEVDHAGRAFTPREYPVVLAPLAARALRNLSWKGSRTLRTPPIKTPLGSRIDFTMEANDRFARWGELASGVGGGV